MASQITDYIDKVFCGDTREVGRKLPDRIFSALITSSPYLLVRNYKGPRLIWPVLGWDPAYVCDHQWTEIKPPRMATPGDKPGPNGFLNSQYSDDENRPYEISYSCDRCHAWKGQLGLEPNPDLFVGHLADVFEAWKHTMRLDGSLWANIGDKLGTSMNFPGIQDLSWAMVPESFASEMQARGWILRDKVIWKKKNPRPDSDYTKFPSDYEMYYHFVLSNTPLYYVNKKTKHIQRERPEGTKGIQEADWFVNKNENKQTLWEPKNYVFYPKFDELKCGNVVSGHNIGGKKAKGYGNPELSGNAYNSARLFGRAWRSVWVIDTSKSQEEHYAGFPLDLARIPMETCCPVDGICPVCDIPRFKIQYVREGMKTFRKKTLLGWEEEKVLVIEVKEEGLSDCGCGAPVKPACVADPFGGQGTVGVAAKQLGLNYTLVDLSTKYCSIMERALNTKMVVV